MSEAGALAYCVQKHAARRLHYDFRLELGGALKSWAVTRGPSLVAGERRLAVAVEDHALSYGAFEGVIEAGAYGAGIVLLWDRGTWVPDGDAEAALASGSLAFTLNGSKLTGRWRLMRMKPRPRERQPSWLLVKSRDAAARDPEAPDILEAEPRSVASGRTLEEIAAAATGRRDD
ncbi:DNA polymerase ligase N-terminal domain-containing protein [Methylobacterium sp. A54F]